VGIGAVVPQGKRIPPRSVAVGVPAKVVRRATDGDIRMIRRSYRDYVRMAERYADTGAFVRSLSLARR
jgi:carbonic anhydrase/acetyltransferase-like protein (isoleucine patch superfamily)